LQQGKNEFCEVLANNAKKNRHQSETLKNRHYEKLVKTEIVPLIQTQFLFILAIFKIEILRDSPM